MRTFGKQGIAHPAARRAPRYPHPMRTGGTLRIARLAGIDIRISPTWLVILALVAFQWVPVAGGFAVPAMALITYGAYRSVYRRLALEA